MTYRIIQNIVELNQAIEDAIENRECFLIGGDFNMVAAWDLELDILVKFAKENGYVD